MKHDKKAAALQWDMKTPWTLLLYSGPEHRSSLEQLLQIYQRPVYAYYRAHGVSSADAEDRTQELLMDFFLIRGSHKKANPARGLFRNYLFTAARNALLDWQKSKNAARRGGDKKIFSLNQADQAQWQCEPTSKLAPEEEYERQWAVTTWSTAFDLFKSRHDSDAVNALEVFYFASTKLSQREAAAKFGITVAAFNSRLHNARRQLFECLTEVVSATVENPADVKGELDCLRQLLEKHRIM
jgi:RNA polymerase sigma-70 factor (ECF subfamily)